MRSLLFVLLVACGGGSRSAPPAVSNQSSTGSAQQPIAENTRPTCTTFSPQCTIATLESFRISMCACKDKACAAKTNDEMTAWGVELGKAAAGAKDEPPNPELSRKLTDSVTKYTECMTKLMMGSTPLPDPCAGDADLCDG